jgi:hypothetical protein
MSSDSQVLACQSHGAIETRNIGREITLEVNRRYE